MTDTSEIDGYVEELQNYYSNVKVFSVVPMGIIMIIYFFTFAMLIDRGMYGVLFFEIATSLLFVYAIVTINHWPIYVVKWRYRNKMPHRDIIIQMGYEDYVRSVESVKEKLKKAGMVA